MDDQNFLQLAMTKQVALTALKITIIVGTLLAIINYGDKIISSSMLSADWIKLGLSYFVPYSVSTFSAVKAIQDCDV